MQPEQTTGLAEFTVIGQTMEKVTFIYGAFLCVWGCMVSALSGSESVTSLIPAFIGAPLVIVGLAAIQLPQQKKLLMHIAVLIGLFIVIGGLDFLRGFTVEGGPFANPWAGLSKGMLLITGLIFTALCVQSFIFARKNRNPEQDS